MSRLTIGKPPTLISNHRITLRRYEPDDAEFLYAAARESTAEVFPFLEWCHADYQIEESHNWIALVYQKWLKGEWFAFDHLALQRLEIVIAENNFASIRVAEKCGAILEGTLRNRLFLHGTPTDALLYSLIPSDFQ